MSIKHLSIKQWPESERPREKLLLRGPDALSDAELLAIFLRTGTRGKSAVDVARELLNKYGGLRALLKADKDSFCSGLGLGKAKFALLQAVLEMSRRHLYEVLEVGDVLTSPQNTQEYLTTKLRDIDHEVFACLYLDNRHSVIKFKILFNGTIDGASVYSREVVKQALKYNAAAVIFAHNHPSGVAEPSHADELLTQRLVEALKLVDIRVLDHIIVGNGRCVSFAERGLI